MGDTILYSSCFDANGSLFEAIFISDSLNYAAIIDSVRISTAKGFRYANNDMGRCKLNCRKPRGGVAGSEAKPSDIPNREARNPSGM
ncbi:2-amino-3-ketobutyrate coenzyme A ligase [Mesorhizobium loti]|nr:2-amino-3-ketobutyrate coenzyme A ligase [Mesorhizobium loti]